MPDFQQPFLVKDEEIAELMRDALVKQTGLQMTSPDEVRALLEQENGAWLEEARTMDQKSDVELFGTVLLRGNAATAKLRLGNDKKPEPAGAKQGMAALDSLRARRAQMQQRQAGRNANTATQPTPQWGNLGKPLPDAPARQETPEEVERNAQAVVTVEDKGMTASLRLTSPKPGGRDLDEDEIRRTIFMSGVTYGVEDIFLERLMAFPIYGRPIRIAKGLPPVNGKDGRVEYRFETEYSVRPEIDANGNADFKEIQFVKNVIKGDVLCEIIPPSEAVDGCDVYGNPVVARQGKPALIQPGQNVEFNEEKTYLIATCDGQPMLKGGKVIVNQVLSLTKVDVTTGNITFFGSVEVIGDVSSGFCINAGGDITVKGFVENASLTAGGNVVLMKGMNGGGVGLITAGDSVRSQFLEQVTVRAAHNIYGDVMLNCDLQCDGRVILTGKKGCLSGGSCRVQKELQVNTLGNEAELDTRVEIRDNESSAGKLEQNQLRRAVTEKSLQRIMGMTRILRTTKMDEDSKRMTVFRLLYLKQYLNRQLIEMAGEANRLIAAIQNESSMGLIVVYTRLYSNVQIMIDGIANRTTMEKGASAIRRRGAEIVYEASLPPRYAEK